MQPNKTHLASVLTLVVLALAILFILSISVILGIGSIISLFSGEATPASEMIASGAFAFQSVVLLACGWFVLEKARGREKADLPFQFPFALWQILPIFGIFFFGIILGGIITLTEIPWLGWFTLPILSVLVIALPIWMFFGLGSSGIEAGPRWRFFATFGLSMTIAPLVMVILESVVLIGIVVIAAVYLAISQPTLFDELVRLMQVLANETNPDLILSQLSPYLANPFLIGTVIGYIALLVPLIEELLKPLAVWLFAWKIESPAQGFVLGMLSGAAFGLFESLNASADGTVGWSVIVIARAGTSLLHMTASGLMGWGILSAVKEKKYGRFAAAYLTSVLVHGIWNAAAAGAGISAIGESIGRPEWLFNYAPALLCGLIVMAVGMFAVLTASNRKIKNSTKIIEAAPPQP